LFDGIDPSDINMGSCNNCYMLAALSGMAEAREGEDEDSFGKRIKERFLTKKVNKAGCYALKFIVDGEERVVVVDDYFPFKKMKYKEIQKDGTEKFRFGREIFAFTKTKIDENEIWV
jgi:hypothetical protein